MWYASATTPIELFGSTRYQWNQEYFQEEIYRRISILGCSRDLNIKIIRKLYIRIKECENYIKTLWKKCCNLCRIEQVSLLVSYIYTLFILFSFSRRNHCRRSMGSTFWVLHLICRLSLRINGGFLLLIKPKVMESIAAFFTSQSTLHTA